MRIRAIFRQLPQLFVLLTATLAATVAQAEYQRNQYKIVDGKKVYEYPVEPFRDPAEPGIIRLDTSDPTLDAERVRVDPSTFPAREPGLINVHRYQLGMNNSGVRTFLSQPLALTPEDLRAADVDVAIFGAPQNSGINPFTTGDLYGPLFVRSAWMDFHIFYSGNDNVFVDHETLISPSEYITFVDYGDAPYIGDVERSSAEVRRVAYEIAEAGAIPLAIGGDHSIPYATVQGIADHIGPGTFGIVHFDAHIDHTSGKGGFGWMVHSAKWMEYLIENEVVAPGYAIMLGAQSAGFNAATYAKADEYFKMKRFPLHMMLRDGADLTLEKVLKQLEGIDKIYITFDIDIIAAAYAPGTGSAETEGVSPNYILPFLRKLVASKELVGMDIVEYQPFNDNRSQPTGKLVNRLMLSTLTGIAMRQEGIDPMFVNPLMSNPENHRPLDD